VATDRYAIIGYTVAEAGMYSLTNALFDIEGAAVRSRDAICNTDHLLLLSRDGSLHRAMATPFACMSTIGLCLSTR
jgi:hypothetical protein